ncbi:hypothetical protein VTK73DRAFT_4288 [Phialemonium thermophilum]|uniref:Uncharacterized protein n=1 Tax=Phialemonium thermophilum TaxID=223376 RepID=A0ABR3V9S7_9PEZI
MSAEKGGTRLPSRTMTVLVPVVLAVLALLAGPALAHGGLANYTVGDTWYRGYDPDEAPDEQIGQPWMVQRVRARRRRRTSPWRPATTSPPSTGTGCTPWGP